MEKLDVFDAFYDPLTPPVAGIDEVHQKGLWHRTFACWVADPQANAVLLQQRGPRNRIDPGSFDASASGHLAAGERPEDGFRELREELGINIAPDDRAALGVFRNMAVRGSYINNEFCHVFVARSVAPLSSLQLQAGEVAGVFSLGIEAGIGLFSGRQAQARISGIVLQEGSYTPQERSISVQDMCNWRERCEVSRYYLKALMAARDFLRGEKIVAI